MKKYISLLLAGYLVLNGCSQSSEIETNESSEQNSAAQTEAANPDEVIITAEQAKNLGIILGSPTEQTMGTTLQLSGEVDVPPAGLVSISVPYGGFLRQTDLMPGVHIRKGQVLAVLEHPDYIQIQQDYLDTKTKITLAQQEYARQKELVDEKVAALKNLQQVQAELQLLKNSQAALRQKLLLLNIN
ncbi:MAG: efflux transporter periplasmic adaptor subunit, partial [Cytophagales bacterium CG18_big_fil_WC_8_21_14_2_50_42_9]